ncbi:hypothetical protein Slash_54 [Bacillus phage Slash]|uniref:Uncharacterized protein n=1 Tax=Bacillus phage Slash TaxID=1406790 RepID=U5Q0D8_9CAUD|nr:hypothetical protein Slash_54 [Bacillus phage Slash]AGY48343.1 hypothetical protein Slash_54 [Bacillus phage Slash]
MDQFKLGVKGEGYAFFLPDSYNKDTKVIGGQMRRSISGKAKRDIITTKKVFSLGFTFLSADETAAIYEQFLKNIEDGKNLTFADDEGVEYTVMFANDSFGISDRQAADEVFWSGNINLEEV